MAKFKFKMNCKSCGIVLCESICIKSRTNKYWNSCSWFKPAMQVDCWKIICTICNKTIFENE